MAREATARTPLVPLRVLRSRNVALANLIQVLSVAGMFGMFFLGALYLRRVLGYDALRIGLAFLPVTVTMATLSIRYSERLLMRRGPRRTLTGGLLLIGAGLVLFALAPVHSSYLTGVLPSMLLLGTGAGLLPRPDGSGDVRGDTAGRGSCLRAHQHDRPGRRCARAGRARDPVGFT